MIKLDNAIYEIEAKDVKEILKQRQVNSHKGMYGTVGIMGGSLEYAGAIKLASRSATRCGCGIVRVIIPKNIVPIVSPFLLEETLYQINYDNCMKCSDDEVNNLLKNLNSIAIGMGWGINSLYEDILNKIILTFKGNLVIDADGLNILSNMNLDILRTAEAKIILTPHMKEFSRLTKLNIDEINKNKYNIATEFARKYNVILLLKGHETIITDGKLVYITKTGGAGMATAGSGDVLSGVLASILGYNQANLLTVATASYLSGLSGSLAEDKYTDISMRSSDIIEFIPQAIKSIRSS